MIGGRKNAIDMIKVNEKGKEKAREKKSGVTPRQLFVDWGKR